MAELRIGIVGYGKIAQDQHAPAIAADPHFTLAAAVTRGTAPGLAVPVYSDHHAMLAVGGLDAVAVCTPAAARHDIARDCLDAGLHVLLEKPPGATLGEVADLARCAATKRRTLFTTWHAQYNAAVEQAAAIVAREGLAALGIEWFEDVETWHPGQTWIWQPGGFGVFDAGINALSIATRISPSPLLLRSARFLAGPDSQQPIAATLELATADAGPFTAQFDWRPRADEHWQITLRTKAGSALLLSQGGARLAVNGAPAAEAAGSEYAAVYTRFAKLIEAGESLVDVEPLRLLADAFLNAAPGDGQAAPRTP